MMDYWKYNILSALNCVPQLSQEMLQQEPELLQSHDKSLQGVKFTEYLVPSAKSK